MSQKIALVWGGTGGHIMPILSLVAHLSIPHKNYFWMGGKNSMEQEKSKEAGIRFIPITTYKLTSTKSFGVLFYPFKLLQGIWDARKVLEQERPKFVFSKGGPGSVAVGIAAWSLGIPLYIHESDTVPGFSNKILGRFATHIFLGFEEARKYFPKDKTTVIGQILHPQFFEKNPALTRKDSGSLEKWWNLSWKSSTAMNRTENSTVNEETEIWTQSSHFTKIPIEWKTDKKHIFVSCGSQGSRKIFQTLLDQKKNFPDTEWILSLGTLNRNLRSEFEKWKDTQVFDWIPQEDIPHILDGTDISITRASATTLAELSTRPIHLVIIPLALSAGNHQARNAQVYEKNGHTVILEEDLEKKNIGDMLRSFHRPIASNTKTIISPILRLFED